MNRSLFFVLILLLMCCISGHAQESNLQESALPIVQTSPLREPKSSYYYYATHLMDVNDTLVAITAATYEVSGNYRSPVELLTQITPDGGVKWYIKRFTVSYINREEFNTNKRKSLLNSHRAAIVLLEPFNKGKVSDESQKVWYTFHVLLKPLGFPTNVTLGKFIPEIVEFPLKHGNVTFQGFVGDTSSPILTMKSSTLVFPVQLNTSTGKITSGIMLLRPSDHHWVLGGVLPHEDTYNPAILEWEDDKLMMIVQHTNGYYRVYESTDLGATWKESTETLSRVWVKSPIPVARGSQNKFITATIDGKDVILFAQSIVTGKDTELHLWLTDKTHIYNVGLISKGENATTNSLLLNGKGLYSLFEGSKGEKFVLLFMDMTGAMEQIKKVLKKWNDQDAIASNGRCCADTICTPSHQCEYHVPINGLVGYLSGNIAGDKWNDEYLCVNATIKGNAGKGSNGLTFKGADSGAMWPVSRDGPARQYYFTNYAFTLAALVTIHEEPITSTSPLLGVKLKNSKNEILLGVSYNNDNTWNTINKETESKSTSKWEVNKEYSVILTFKNGEGSVYINGIRLNVGTELKITEGEEISYFYFGAYSEDESASTTESKDKITVKDVMLYNRVLSDEEIAIFLKNKMNITFPQHAEAEISEETTAAAASPAPVIKSATGSENATSTQETTTPTKTVTVPASEPKPAPKSASQPVIPPPAFAEMISQTTEPPVSQRLYNQVKKEEIVPPKTNIHSEKKEMQQIPKKGVLVEESEKKQEREYASEYTTSTEVTAPDINTNTEQESPLHKITFSNTINNAKTQKKRSDDTVLVYGSGLSMFLLVLWSLATVLP